MLSVNGDTVSTEYVDDEPPVIKFENTEDTAWRCAACGDSLSEEVGGYTDESGSAVCSAYDPDDDPNHDDESGPNYGDGPHRPERVGLSWVNGAGIHADPGEDSITVTLSVGDPRGAFTFTVRRVPDDADTNGGRLILHTPYPGEPTPHVELTEDHTGTYWLG